MDTQQVTRAFRLAAALRGSDVGQAPIAERSLGGAQLAPPSANALLPRSTAPAARASTALTGLGRAQRSEHGRPYPAEPRGSNPYESGIRPLAKLAPDGKLLQLYVYGAHLNSPDLIIEPGALDMVRPCPF